jgi:hypothetical protein
MEATTGPWRPYGPAQFTDIRTRLTRDSGLIYQAVRAFHGVIVRAPLEGEPRGPVYDRCPHAHNKPSAARKCAEAAANRLNRALAKGEDWAWRKEVVK